MRESEEYRNAKAEEWGKTQLAEITELTGGAVTKLEQIDKAVFDAVKPGGDLVGAYMAIHGRDVLKTLKTNGFAKQQADSTQHLASPGAVPPPATHRPPTVQEKHILSQFAQFSTSMEKDLDKIQVPK
jgi:hypothetical protein